MNEEQFNQMMAVLTSIDQKLTFMVNGSEADRHSMESLIAQLTQEDKPSTSSYFNQRLMGGRGHSHIDIGP